MSDDDTEKEHECSYCFTDVSAPQFVGERLKCSTCGAQAKAVRDKQDGLWWDWDEMYD